MRYNLYILFFSIISCLFSQETVFVSSLAEFNNAHDNANQGDSIVWIDGTYSNIFMDITKSSITVTAETPGEVVFNGSSKVEIDGDDVTLSALQFVGGNIGTSHVIRIWGSDVMISHINIQDYTSYKYLIVDEDSRRTTISYCNFENRINQADQNILSILVDEVGPGYHLITHCSFKNFPGGGNDEGVEPIRIGVSSQSHLDSRTIVEYCYFTACDGDGEIISYKAAQNVIRYNTFEGNSKAELVLRHGDEAIVYSNFFINNMGGVRVREGSGHFIYNNYFEGLSRRAIYLQNDPSDPLEDIHIYHNTILNSQEFILGGEGGNPPSNVVIANNIFTNPQESLFEDATGNEQWIGNISFGSIGITRPNGLENLDPEISQNVEGYYQLTSTSPAIDASQSGYPSVPLFDGLNYDNEIMLDLMKQTRPNSISERDLGAWEYSADGTVQPLATETNTGPSYLSEEQGFKISTFPVGGGTIALDPSGPSFQAGTIITATAIPEDGNRLLRWTGELSGTDNPQSFMISGDMDIGAVFESILYSDETHKLNIYPNPTSNKIIVEWSDQDFHDSTVEIIAIDGTKMNLAQDTLLDGSGVVIDISKLSSGIYFLHCLINPNSLLPKDTIITKFIKE